ncbi:MAG: hypothetical protein ACI4L1_00990 [Christensenellales bacterium]
MKSFLRRIGGVKYRFFDGIREHKKTTLFLIVFCLIGLLTGIFTAIRYSKGGSLICFNDFCLCKFISGELGSSELFLSRLFSSSVVIIISLICSTTIFLAPVNFILLTYRAYLVSLNCTLIIILNGIGGIVTCLLIILPCQLIGLLILALFCSFSCKRAVTKRRYGVPCKICAKFFLCYIGLILINGIETLLLFLFSSKIILVL